MQTQSPMHSTTALLESIQDAGQDFEWYPTTQEMIAAVAKRLTDDVASVLDIGAGDGRVLVALSETLRHRKADQEAKRYAGIESYTTRRKPTREEVEEHRREAFKTARGPELYSIEKSSVLAQAQPGFVIPAGTDFYEQNLSAIEVDVIFCNPPYSDFDAWAAAIINTAYASRAYLVLPRRWRESEAIKKAIKRRGATAKAFYEGDFHHAERRARAVIDIVEVRFRTGDYDRGKQDPFDVWFEENVKTLDQQEELSDYQQQEKGLARLRHADTIDGLVAAYNEEYTRFENNYRTIFSLDAALLTELGVNKNALREGIKKRVEGLKTLYWAALFEKLDTITSRLSTATKTRFLEKITRRSSVAFTHSNCYAVVLWAIKNANRYYNEQLVQLFRDLSTHDGVMNYKSNQRTWKSDGWRHRAEDHSHYALDYRIVVHRYGAISSEKWDAPGGLQTPCHELIDDIIAVFGNLGFTTRIETGKEAARHTLPPRHRFWTSNVSQEFRQPDTSLLFEVKAFKNGNVHLRFKPAAIKALNVEAGRLLGWIKDKSDVVTELGYTPEEAEQFFGCNRALAGSGLRLLAAPTAAVA